MDNELLEEIKNLIVLRLNQKYGFAGVASGSKFAMLTTSTPTTDIVISIKETPSENNG